MASKLSSSEWSDSSSTWARASLAWQQRRAFVSNTEEGALTLRFDAAEFSVETFREQCQNCNRPCLISNVDLAGNATGDWVQPSDGRPDWARMGKLFGESLVPVTMTCETPNVKVDADTDATTIDMKFQAFVDMVMERNNAKADGQCSIDDSDVDRILNNNSNSIGQMNSSNVNDVNNVDSDFIDNHFIDSNNSSNINNIETNNSSSINNTDNNINSNNKNNNDNDVTADNDNNSHSNNNNNNNKNNRIPAVNHKDPTDTADVLVPYCKDWHLHHEFPDYKIYETPKWFCDDWLNEWWDTKNTPTANLEQASVDSQHGKDEQGRLGTENQADISSDYRFLYAGAEGSYTPLHHDVFLSNSWSINVCGMKLWALFPPESAARLKDMKGDVMHNVFHPDLDLSQFPNVTEALPMEIVVQTPGTAIFVPSGWYHQVLNLCDTISINHNWFNRHNIMQVSCYLLDQLQLCRHAINDCRSATESENVEGELQIGTENRLNSSMYKNMNSAVSESNNDQILPIDLPWERLCQTILGANCGMTIHELHDLLATKIETGDNGNNVDEADRVTDRLAAEACIARIRADPALSALLDRHAQQRHEIEESRHILTPQELEAYALAFGIE